MFAIGRMPGWIANWKEVREGDNRIYRPRQVYFGEGLRDYTPIQERKQEFAACILPWVSHPPCL
jgi:citrate synthase